MHSSSPEKPSCEPAVPDNAGMIRTPRSSRWIWPRRLLGWSLAAVGLYAFAGELFVRSQTSGGHGWLPKVFLVEIGVLALGIVAARWARPARASMIAFGVVIVTGMGSLVAWATPNPTPAGVPQAQAACENWEDYIFSGGPPDLSLLTTALAKARAAALADSQYVTLYRDLGEYTHTQIVGTEYASDGIGGDCTDLFISHPDTPP
jgi:hypothetical protein